MEFKELIKQRSSVRSYEDKVVSRDIIETILDAGRLAPSAKNLQPWYFVVVQDENLEKVKKCYGREWISVVSTIIVICADYKNSWIRADGKNHADIDCAIAIDHMTLSAAEKGLGTCWICKFDAFKCAEILNCPEGIAPVALLPIGYPLDSEKKNKKRKELKEIVIKEGF